MARILVLAESGMGKSTSLGKVEILNIEGLDPKQTFIVNCSGSNKGLPFPGWMKQYKVGTPPDAGNYYQTTDASVVAKIVKIMSQKDHIKNIVIDDANYLMQDYYMKYAMKSGYDVFKKIGLFMGELFDSFNTVPMLAHFEDYNINNSGQISFRMKTVGKMTNQYITPEGKFEIVLFGIQRWNDQEKKVEKLFVTNFDGDYPAKSPIGMFEQLYIPNVLKLVDKYNNG